MASSDPDDKPGGERLPAAASGPLADGQALRFPAWVPSRCVSCFFCLWASSLPCRAFLHKVILDQKNWQVLIWEADLMFFPLGLYFAQRRLDPMAYINIVSEPSPWRPECWAGGRGEAAETYHTVPLLLHHLLPQRFLSYANQILINTKGSSEGEKLRNELSVTWDERELSG